MTRIHLTVNGKPVARDVEPRTHLADFLREALNLTGTHLGCEHGICGACTIEINGEIVRSCITYAAACDGADVRTIEDFDDDPLMSRLRQAFSENHALQCGYCTPGMLIAGRDLIRRRGDLSEKEIRLEMSGNLCRCTGYMGIIQAIQQVIAERESFPLGEDSRTQYLGPAPGLVGGPEIGAEPAPRQMEKELDVTNSEPANKDPAPSVSPLSEVAGLTQLTQTLRVAYPLRTVWNLMRDLETVAMCMPGAKLESISEDGRLSGTMSAKLGPISASFAGDGQVTLFDHEYRAQIEGQGRDQKSASRARGRITYELSEVGPEVTDINVAIDYALTGPLAQFGRSTLVQDFVERLTETFARNLEAKLSAQDGGEAVHVVDRLDAGALIWTVVLARLKKLFARIFGRR